MLFACRLENIRYIWIDSLCIIQPVATSIKSRDATSEQDWKEQSRDMGTVYRNSYLNISATAAEDGDKGLFLSRSPENLWEDEVNVNYAGTTIFGSGTGHLRTKDQLIRCTLIDLSLWTELVDQAPVNRRGWVLQEVTMLYGSCRIDLNSLATVGTADNTLLPQPNCLGMSRFPRSRGPSPRWHYAPNTAR